MQCGTVMQESPLAVRRFSPVAVSGVFPLTLCNSAMPHSGRYQAGRVSLLAANAIASIARDGTGPICLAMSCGGRLEHLQASPLKSEILMTSSDDQCSKEGRMVFDRRRFIAASCLTLGLSAMARPAIAQARTQIRVGYLHTLAVDAQIWLCQEIGAWLRNGLAPQFIEFKTGLELFDAMAAGRLDMLATGAVISNFPARGRGKMFLVNSVEYATAQLWVREEQGIKDIADLRGRLVATTVGTTAHVFLDKALRANGIDPREIEIQNQRMPEAVNSFISGAVPAVVLWVPFNITVQEKVPQAKKLLDAGEYYPETAIVGGWAASNAYYAQNRPVLVRVIRAWAEGNDMLIARTNESLELLHKNYYQGVPERDLKEQFGAERVFPTSVWRRLYSDGTVVRWLQQVSDFFVRIGGIENPVPAAQYFDPSLFLSTVRK